MSPRSRNQNADIRKVSMQKIASAAMVLFMEEGYLNVTIDQIAKGANISKGLMYNYFTGKEQLLSFIIDQIIAEMSEFSKNILKESDPIKKMEILIKITFKLLREKADFWKTVMPVITQKAISLKMQGELLKKFKTVTKDLEQMFKACKVKNAEIEAYQLGALLDGIAWHYFFLFKEDYPLKKIENEILVKYTNLLRHGQ